MPVTYDKIATTTLGSAQASVTFSSISGSYTDLVVVIAGSSSAGGTIIVQYNGDSGTNYSWTYLNGNGSSASSGRVTSYAGYGLGEIRTYQGNAIAHIQNYSNSTTFKTALCRANTASDYVQSAVALWRSTSAITSINFTVASSTFASGTTFNIYGIKAF